MIKLRTLPASLLRRDDVIVLGGDLVRVIGLDAMVPYLDDSDQRHPLVTEDETGAQYVDYVVPDRMFTVARPISDQPRVPLVIVAHDADGCLCAECAD